MAVARHDQGDPELHALFERFDGRLVSPGGAANLLGLSRKTIHTLGERGELRIFRSKDSPPGGRLVTWDGPAWAYIPLEDVARYGKKVGRRLPNSVEDLVD